MSDDLDDPRLPEPLVRELSQLYRVDIPASTQVDRMITNAARAHLLRRGRLRWLKISSGVAAGILIILSTTFHLRPAEQLAGDVNRDGAVDIRDALALARQIEARQNVGQGVRQDINRDGVTDRRDVDAIAAIAVRLQ